MPFHRMIPVYLCFCIQCVAGSIGLLFTNKTVDEVKRCVGPATYIRAFVVVIRVPLCSRRYFAEYSELDYARGGAVVDEAIVMTPEAFAEFNMTYTMLEPLKKLGLNVRLDHGVLVLDEPYTVCNAGDTLTPEQARLLVRVQHILVFALRGPRVSHCAAGLQKLFWKPLATFRIKVVCSWSDGKFEKYDD